MRYLKLSAVYALSPETEFDVVIKGELTGVLKLLNDLGYDGIEYNIPNPFNVEVSRLKRHTFDYNLRVSALSTGLSYLTYGYSLSSPSKELREKALSFFKKYIELSVDLESFKVVIGLARGTCGSKDNPCDEALRRFKNSLKILDDYAVKHNVTLLLEPLNRYETRLINKLDLAIGIAREFKSVKILLDTFHTLLEERNVYDSINRVGALLGHVHVADSNRLAPGMGMLDWERIIYRLVRIGYKGYLSVEARVEPSLKELLEISIRTLKPLII